MKNKVLAFGCSHTQGGYLTEEDRWPNLVAELIKLPVENLGIGAAGLFEIIDKAKKVEHDVKLVILQKPMMNRYPWYCKPEEYRPLGSVRYARERFNCLLNFAKNIVLKDIFKAECEMLDEFREIFSESNILFWHYWFDHFYFAQPEFVKYNLKYEQHAEHLSMINLGTIWHPCDLPWNGDARISGKIGRLYSEFCVNEKMIRAIADGHPLRRHNVKVAKRIQIAYEEILLNGN